MSHLTANLDPEVQEQIRQQRQAESPEVDPEAAGHIKDYFQNTSSRLQEFGQLPARDYEASLELPLTRPIRQRKNDFIPFMIRLVPPDIFPSGTVQEIGTIPTPQNADVEVDLEETSGRAASGPAPEPPGSPVKAKATIEDGTDTKPNLVATPQTREGIQTNDNDPEKRYERFRNSYRRTNKRINNDNTKLVEGRQAVIEPGAKLESHTEDGRFTAPADDFGREENQSYLNSQAEMMQETAPLFFYINPETFDKSYDKIQSSTRVRGRGSQPTYIIQKWGQEQPSISASGTIGAFYVNQLNRRGENTGGLAVDLRRGSFAYQHLMTIYHIYRNNGYIYNVYDIPSLVGAVQIFYDGAIYTGSFDSFEISQSEDNPFTMEYSFEFTVRFEEEIGKDPHV